MGDSVVLCGDADHDGTYTVTGVQPDSVILEDQPGREVVLSPRHVWLHDSEGNHLDPWTICNVFVGGRHLTNGVASITTQHVLLIDLGS